MLQKLCNIMIIGGIIDLLHQIGLESNSKESQATYAAKHITSHHIIFEFCHDPQPHLRLLR